MIFLKSLAAFALMFFYWKYLDMFQTIRYLALISIPLLIGFTLGESAEACGFLSLAGLVSFLAIHPYLSSRSEPLASCTDGQRRIIYSVD